MVKKNVQRDSHLKHFIQSIVFLVVQNIVKGSLWSWHCKVRTLNTDFDHQRCIIFIFTKRTTIITFLCNSFAFLLMWMTSCCRNIFEACVSSRQGPHNAWPETFSLFTQPVLSKRILTTLASAELILKKRIDRSENDWKSATPPPSTQSHSFESLQNWFHFF